MEVDGLVNELNHGMQARWKRQGKKEGSSLWHVCYFLKALHSLWSQIVSLMEVRGKDSWKELDFILRQHGCTMEWRQLRNCWRTDEVAPGCGTGSRSLKSRTWRLVQERRSRNDASRVLGGVCLWMLKSHMNHSRWDRKWGGENAAETSGLQCSFDEGMKDCTWWEVRRQGRHIGQTFL